MRSQLFKKSLTRNTIADPSIAEENNIPMHCVAHVSDDTSITTQTLSYEKNCGDLKVDDIIWYVRSYLTDDDLIHYNQLSRAFSGKYNLEGEYIWHQIEAADLSFDRQARLIERFSHRYKNNPVFPVSPTNTWQKLLYHQYKAENPYHNIDKSFYYNNCLNLTWRQHYSASFFTIPPLTLTTLLEHKQAPTPRTRNFLSSIPLALRNIIAEHSNPKENERLTRLMKCYAHFQILIDDGAIPFGFALLMTSIAWIVSTIIICQRYIYNSVPGIANIHTTQINIWTETPELHIVSCEQALSPNNVSRFGNFSALMTLSDFTENLTKAALLACTTWLENCRPSANFDSQYTNLDKLLQVGCDYPPQDSSALKVLDSIFIILLLSVPASIICAILAITLQPSLQPFLQRLKDEPILAVAKALKNIPPENFVKEKEADKIIQFHSHFFKNVHCMLTEEMRKEAASTEREGPSLS